MKSLAYQFSTKMNAINATAEKIGDRIDNPFIQIELQEEFFPVINKRQKDDMSIIVTFKDRSKAKWYPTGNLWTVVSDETPAPKTDEAANEIAKTILNFPGVSDVFIIQDKPNKIEIGVVCNHVDYFSFLASEFEKPSALPKGIMLTVRRFVDPDHWFMYSHPSKPSQATGLNT